MARIMVVDDEQSMRELVRMMLKIDGHIILEAGSGEEALEVLGNEKPDLILLDVMMPGMDGWETCKEIKANKKTSDIPIVMFTVRGKQEDKDKSMEHGADGHISKPFEMDDLLDTIKKLL